MAVTTDLLHKLAPRERQDGKKTDKKNKRSGVKPKLTISEDEMLENRFAFLCDMREQQSGDDDE